MKPGHLPIKQKPRPKPHHLQNYVQKNKLNKSGHLEKVQKVDNCFVSPVVITVKKKLVKIALDSRKLNDSCTKIRPYLPNIEELLNQLSNELTREPAEPLRKSRTDLEYAYGNLKLPEETSKDCNFAITGRIMKGYYRFRKSIKRFVR